jgi:hypothetical protein
MGRDLAAEPAGDIGLVDLGLDNDAPTDDVQTTGEAQ